MPTRKVLTIDGGGIKGVFAASLLAEVEHTIGRPVASHFDLIVGTSTGGILALGLGFGLSANRVLSLYEDRGPAIFKGNRRVRLLRSLVASKYDRGPLHSAVQDVFGDRLLGESSTRLVIPSVNLQTGEVHVFKTAHHQRFVRDYSIKATDVAMATAAAPVYFPTHRLSTGIPLVDGGMWANNPMGAAAVEALGVLEWQRGDVRLLSIGSPHAPLSADADQSHRLGLGNYWATRIVDVFMTSQSSASLGTAQLLLGHDNVARIAPSVPARQFSLDGVGGIRALKGLGASEARKGLPRMQPFFDSLAEPFEPFKTVARGAQS